MARRRKRSNLSSRSRKSVRLRKMRSQYTEEQLENERRNNRLRIARVRASLTDEQREEARKISRLATRSRRARQSYQNKKKMKSEIPSRLTLRTTLKVKTKKKRATKIKTEQEIEDEAVEIKTENENQMYADIMEDVQCSSQFALLTVIKSEIDIEPTNMVEPRQLYEFEQSLDESVECWRVTETSEDPPL